MLGQPRHADAHKVLHGFHGIICFQYFLFQDRQGIVPQVVMQLLVYFIPGVADRAHIGFFFGKML